MKMVIFGATGKVGRRMVDQALEQGHEVTAFVRNPEKLGVQRQNLKIKQGDVLDPAAVRDAIRGQDAVLCAIGMPLFNKEGLRAKGTDIIVAMMQEVGVQRLICLSGLGTGDSWDILSFKYKYFIFPLFMRRVYTDHERQETIVRNSELDWTIVRPGSLINGEETGQYRHGFTAADESPTLKISYADVAGFMLKQSTDNTYLHQSPCLSY